MLKCLPTHYNKDFQIFMNGSCNLNMTKAEYYKKLQQGIIEKRFKNCLQFYDFYELEKYPHLNNLECLGSVYEQQKSIYERCVETFQLNFWYCYKYHD